MDLPWLRHISHTVIHGTSAGKNSRDDVDTETYSIHRFVEHAMEGAAFALDQSPALLAFISSLFVMFVSVIIHATFVSVSFVFL